MVAVKLISTSLVSNYTNVFEKFKDTIHPDVRCSDSQYSLTDCVNTHLKVTTAEQNRDFALLILLKKWVKNGLLCKLLVNSCSILLF